MYDRIHPGFRTILVLVPQDRGDGRQSLLSAHKLICSASPTSIVSLYEHAPTSFGGTRSQQSLEGISIPDFLGVVECGSSVGVVEWVIRQFVCCKYYGTAVVLLYTYLCVVV